MGMKTKQTRLRQGEEKHEVRRTGESAGGGEASSHAGRRALKGREDRRKGVEGGIGKQLSELAGWDQRVLGTNRQCYRG